LFVFTDGARSSAATPLLSHQLPLGWETLTWCGSGWRPAAAFRGVLCCHYCIFCLLTSLHPDRASIRHQGGQASTRGRAPSGRAANRRCCRWLV